MLSCWKCDIIKDKLEVIVIRKTIFIIKCKILGFLEKYLSGEGIDFRHVFAIIIPIFVDQAFIICLNMFNTAMISSSGPAAVSAVNMVDSLNIFILNVFIAVSTGGTVIVAQYKGFGDEKMVSRAASSAVSAVGIIGIVVGAILIISHNGVLALLFGGAEQAVFSNARIYLIGCAISYPFFAIFEAVCGALRGVGDTKSSMWLSMFMNLSYLGLNFLFINVFHMGIIGMAISINVARMAGMLAALIYMLKYNRSLAVKIKSLFKIDFPVARKIFSVGLPFAAEQMFFNGGKLLTQTFIVQLGTLSMTINAICGSMTMLFQIGANALSLSLITVVGQCMGRKNVADARKFIKSFLVMGSISFAIGAACLLPMFPHIVKLFSPPPEIISTVFTIVLMTGLVQPFLWSISFITPSALRAAGDSRFTSITSMLTMWLFRVVLGYVLGIVLKFGIIGVWIAMLSEWAIRGTIFLIRFKGKKWCKHNLIDN